MDTDSADRMLTGEPAGPPELTELLAAATAPAHAGELAGEEAALAAFRANRDAPPVLHVRPSRRQRILTLKTVLIALLLILAGGTAIAATAYRLPAPPRPPHGHVPAAPHGHPDRSARFRTPPPARHDQHDGDARGTALPEERHSEPPRSQNGKARRPPRKAAPPRHPEIRTIRSHGGQGPAEPSRRGPSGPSAPAAHHP